MKTVSLLLLLALLAGSAAKVSAGYQTPIKVFYAINTDVLIFVHQHGSAVGIDSYVRVIAPPPSERTYLLPQHYHLDLGSDGAGALEMTGTRPESCGRWSFSKQGGYLVLQRVGSRTITSKPNPTVQEYRERYVLVPTSDAQNDGTIKGEEGQMELLNLSMARGGSYPKWYIAKVMNRKPPFDCTSLPAAN